MLIPATMRYGAKELKRQIKIGNAMIKASQGNMKKRKTMKAETAPNA